MAPRARRDALLLIMWLGLAALLYARLEAREFPAPRISPSESEKTAASVPPEDLPLRAVRLPPPPPAAPASAAVQTTAKPRVPAPKPAAETPQDATTREVPPPKTMTVKALTPEPPATPKAAAKLDVPPTKDPTPRDPPDDESGTQVKVGQVEAQLGRALLRLLEHGEGPDIELAWPDAPADRRRLHDRLRACFGMTIAVMDRAGRLYRSQAGVLAAWSPNMDFYSGFLRSPTGRLASDERTLLQSARAQIPSASPVRLFRRQVDARLLGGLQSLIGPNYGQLRRIQGHYLLQGNRLVVQALRGDGRPVAGSIDLTPAAIGACPHEVS